MKYYIIAGERSGDLHASNLMKAIVAQDQAAEFRFWGGDEMQKVGGTMVKHYRELAFMGIWEVVQNLRTIFKFLKECKADIKDWQPDVVVLVDYAGFNLRIAKYVKTELAGIKTFFYISPKVWAWNTKRAYKIKANVDRLFVIFPFEVSFFKKFDYEVDYVGNPLLDALSQFVPNPQFKNQQNLGDKPLIALLPGSRKQEVKKLLPEMLKVIPHFPNHQFVVAGVSNLPAELYADLQKYPQVKFVLDQTYDLLTVAESAIVASGTATLETALFNVPQIVIYKIVPITFLIGSLVMVLNHFSLVNLIAEKEVVIELLQNQVHTNFLVREMKKIIVGGEKRAQVLADYAMIKAKMGEVGASQRAGTLMVKYLQNK
ncbi:MAG: lipid-A-disaccharide synthase [Microscillaceae bacterium]|jgi:lipid-A-disaccharide synthase|nr:lipid-A-disaccharide synthase [Microscillaceae bacterium]